MADWAKKLSEEIDRKPQKKNWAQDMAGFTPVQAEGETRLLQTEEEPTGQVSAITGQPEMMPVSAPHKMAGFGTMVETGVVDDPGTKMDILSDRMGIPRNKFAQIEGQIVYQGPDGNMYYAEPRGKLGTAKRGIAGMVSRAPEEIMGTIGGGKRSALGGLLAAGGAGIRKTVGALAYDEPQTTMGNIKEMAVAGGLAYGGGKLGNQFTSMADKTRSVRAARLTKLAKSELTPEKIKETAAIEKLAKEWGIGLFTPQATGSHELIARFELLGNIPVTADRIGKAKIKQYGEIDNAINKWLDTFAPPTVSATGAGEKIAKAAKTAIKSAETIRKNKAKPLYNKAFGSGVNVDPTDAITQIDDLLSKTVKGDPSFMTLTRIKKMIGEAGGDLEKLDRVKRSGIDAVLNKAKAMPTIRYEVAKVKKALVDSMDVASPEYKKARKIWGSESEVINELTSKKRLLGRISTKEGDEVEKIANMLFNSKSRPEILEPAMAAIIKHGGQEAWQDILRVYMADKFDDVVSTGTMNIGGGLRKKIFFNRNQRAILEKAMTPTQKDNFEGLMEVFQRTSLTSVKDSGTAGKLVGIKDMEREAVGIKGRIRKWMSMPLYTFKRMIADFGVELETKRYQKVLADTMLNKNTTQQIQKMLQLKPGSQQLIKQLTTFLALGPGRETFKQRRVKEIELSK